MISLFKAANELQEFFRQEGIPFCFIGGIAEYPIVLITNLDTNFILR
jgi:hypothetical protein